MIERRSVESEAYVERVLSNFLDKPLSERSIFLLNNLCAQSEDEFNHLIADIRDLASSEGGALHLTAAHVDMLLAALDEQMRLPEKSMQVLETLFAGRASRQISIIDALTQERGVPHLDREAEKHHLLYHISAHGRAVMSRALYVLKIRFGLFDSSSDMDRGFEALLGFILRFHDLDQVRFVETTSVETLTAARLNAWLIAELEDLAFDPDMQAIVGFLCQHVIVLGTTMIYSSKSMCDLHQIFFRVEEAYRNAGFSVVSPSNDNFVRMVKIVVLVCSASDKNAAAIQTLAGLEALTDPKTEPCYARMKTLSAFFEEGAFELYYPGANRKINERAFLITLVQHISMCFEIPAKRGNRQAITFVNFIQTCHERLGRKSTVSDFMAWFDNLYAHSHVREAVEAMFFSAIEREKSFSRGQVASLEFIYAQLNALTGVGLVEPSVPETDAKNLDALKGFYDAASEDIKNKLCSDLALVLIFQTGVRPLLALDSVTHCRDILFASPGDYCGNMSTCSEDHTESYARK